MVLISFLAFVAFSATVALADWRRGWLLAIVVGVLQDPARKLTPGQPVFMTFAIIGVYITLLFAVQHRMQGALRDFARRFGQVWSAFGVLFLFLMLAAVNGLVTFGFDHWQAPLLSLFVYLAPLPAVLLGYMYLDNEERLYSFFTFYAVLTSVALIGTPLEYYRVNSVALGMVHQVGDYIRYLPGIEVRMMSGFYRAPDIMGWHAAMLTSISVAMVIRAEMKRSSWPWMLAGGWGFFNCLISGRRKAVYFVVAFAAAFLLRYFRRLKAAQIGAVIMAGVMMAVVIHQLSSEESSSVYAAAAATTSREVGFRLEGGLFETIRQFGVLGAGLGIATQGVQHVLGADQTLSWQEGGLGKLAVELGIPGLLAAALLAAKGLRTAFRISGIPDHERSSQITRATLFALMIASMANFLASAQTYSDPVLTIMTCFLVGCLFATVTLDERYAAAEMKRATQLAPATA